MARRPADLDADSTSPPRPPGEAGDRARADELEAVIRQLSDGVLVVARDGRRLLGLMLSSRSTRDGSPDWLALGSGPWDAEGRPSWVRLDRVLEVPEDGIRREGAVLDRDRFDRVAAALRREHGWA